MPEDQTNAAPGSLLEMQGILASIQQMQEQLTILATQVQNLIDNSLSLES